MNWAQTSYCSLTPVMIRLRLSSWGWGVALVRVRWRGWLRPWGLPLALGLQVLMLLGWIVSPALGTLGLVFCLAWAGMLWMRHEVLRRHSQWAARGD